MFRTRKPTVTLFAWVSALLLPVPTFALETPQFEFDGRPWSLDFEARRGPYQIQEFVLEGESVCCWSELVTWQYIDGWRGSESATEIMRQNLDTWVESFEAIEIGR